MEAQKDVAIGRLIEEMAPDGLVESIQSMNLFHAFARSDPLYPLQPAAKLWHLDELHRVTTGKSVRVAQIDSGVELDHPDLQGRVVIARNFVDAGEVIGEAHGTAVAGIIGARADNGVGIAGVAPDAVLLGLRACWQTPVDEIHTTVCSSFTLAKALQFALDNDARVINLSLGGPEDRLLRRLLAVAESRGVVVVAAADSQVSDGGFPASVPGVLAIAAEGADAPPTMLLAPGRDIPTTLPGRRWGFVSGSSFAAAEVTGLVALLLDLAPGRKPQQIRASLQSDFSSAPPRRREIVDACAAAAHTVGTCVCQCSMMRNADLASRH